MNVDYVDQKQSWNRNIKELITTDGGTLTCKAENREQITIIVTTIVCNNTYLQAVPMRGYEYIVF